MVDGELFLPEEWFEEDFAELRQELGIPKERCFETKIELGLKMVKRAKANGLPFDLLACVSNLLDEYAISFVSVVLEGVAVSDLCDEYVEG